MLITNTHRHTHTHNSLNCSDEIAQTAAQFNTRFIAQIPLQVKNKVCVVVCACNIPGTFLLPIYSSFLFVFYCHGENNIDPDLARFFFRSSTWEALWCYQHTKNGERHKLVPPSVFVFQLLNSRPNWPALQIKISQEIGMLDSVAAPQHFHHTLSELFTTLSVR